MSAPTSTNRRTQCNPAPPGSRDKPLEGIDDGSRVAHDGLPGDDAAEDDGDSAVEDGAGNKGGENTDGHVALGILALLGRSGDGIEADVGEEDDGTAREDACPSVGHEGMPVVGLDEAGSGKDEDEDGGDFDEDHDVVGACRLADAADQDHGEDHDNEEGGNVEAEMPAGVVEIAAREVLESCGEIGGGDPHEGHVNAEPVEEVDDVRGEADADAHVGEGVFEDEVPADDPRSKLAECGVGVGIGRAGDGNHGREFGVAEAGEGADNGDERKRERECRSSSGTAGHGGVSDEPVNKRRIADGGLIEVLPGHGGANDRKDAGADDGADAERGERPRTKAFL